MTAATLKLRLPHPLPVVATLSYDPPRGPCEASCRFDHSRFQDGAFVVARGSGCFHSSSYQDETASW